MKKGLLLALLIRMVFSCSAEPADRICFRMFGTDSLISDLSHDGKSLCLGEGDNWMHSVRFYL